MAIFLTNNKFEVPSLLLYQVSSLAAVSQLDCDVNIIFRFHRIGAYDGTKTNREINKRQVHAYVGQSYKMLRLDFDTMHFENYPSMIIVMPNFQLFPKNRV